MRTSLTRKKATEKIPIILGNRQFENSDGFSGYEAEFGSIAAQWRAHAREVLALVNYENQFAISAGYDQDIKVWNLRTRQLVKTLEKPHQGYTTALRLVGRHRLVSGGFDGRVILWSIASTQKIERIAS